MKRYRLWFHDKAKQSSVGTDIDAETIPTIGHLVSIPDSAECWRVVDVHVMYSHPDSPGYKASSEAIVQVMLEAAPGMFAR